MAVSHRESVLTTSCIQIPVHPHTRAPLTLYEREEERKDQEATRMWRDSLEAHEDDHDSENSTDEVHRCKSSTCKDWVFDISKTCNADTEYYIQLERMKLAHLHNMEQLEKMYERKLYLKGVQNMDIGAGSVKKDIGSAWEQRTSQPLHFDGCFLKHDINSNVSSVLSVGSQDESTEEDCSDSDSLASVREKIVHMWNGFSVEDYNRNTDYAAKSRSKDQIKRKKAKEWSHKVTIPEPFDMTVRESKKREMSVKSKSEIELENNLLKKKLEEEAECQKKFRANPVPASVFLPLYDEIVERNEERRQFVKERSKDILLASQKPFQFIQREERKKEIRKLQLMNFPKSTKNVKHFRAKPVPKSIYGSTTSERLKEEELYRGIRTHMRSQELLLSSTYPTNTLAPKTCLRNKNTKCYQPKEEPAHNPNINASIPNFKKLHQKKILNTKNTKHVTICDPFHLRTEQIPSHKEKILKDIEADEQYLKETRWPFKSPRSHAQMKSPRGHPLSESPRSTESSKKRQQAIRQSLEERERLEEEERKKRANQRERAKLLKKRISIRSKATDPYQTKDLMPHSKLKELRKQQKQRAKEYLKELVAMEERVSKKPLLLERTMQKNARLSAEKHYSNVLKDLGLCEDFVSNKGRTSNLQDHGREEHSSSEEEQSSTEGTLEIADLQDKYENAEYEDDRQEEYSSDGDESENET